MNRVTDARMKHLSKRRAKERRFKLGDIIRVKRGSPAWFWMDHFTIKGKFFKIVSFERSSSVIPKLSCPGCRVDSLEGVSMSIVFPLGAFEKIPKKELLRWVLKERV